MTGPQRRVGSVAVLEALLWTVGIVCLVGFACVLGMRWKGEHASRLALHGGGVALAAAAPAKASEGAVVGRLEIPSLALAVPIVDGIDPMSLTRGVGHIRGTAVPGGLGTVGLAGHRDTYLRALRGIRKGAEVLLVDGTGRYRYVVRSTEVVWPEEVRVLAIQSTPQLALVTCFPFDYVGAAPRRFVVHAELESVTPE